MGLRSGAFEDMKAVVYDFHESHAGELAHKFLGDWKGAACSATTCSATAKALDYSLRRWGAFTQFVDDGPTAAVCSARLPPPAMRSRMRLRPMPISQGGKKRDRWC
ncbi:hypothetical protein GCM10027082_47400 [Comamonas humi]